MHGIWGANPKIYGSPKEKEAVSLKRSFAHAGWWFVGLNSTNIRWYFLNSADYFWGKVRYDAHVHAYDARPHLLKVKLLGKHLLCSS